MTPQIVTDAPWLKPESIEAKAQARLSAYKAEFGATTKLPIPIEHLIEAHLKLRIDWDVIEEKGDDVVLAYINPGEQTICMNECRRAHFENYWGTEVFTLAHEVGHWDLHVSDTEFVQLTLLDDVKPREFLCRWNKYDRLEWQANRYAAALAMPEEMIVREIKGVDICQWPNLYRLKDRFGVTITAFCRRLEELGLIYMSEDGTLCPSRAASCNQLNLI